MYISTCSLPSLLLEGLPITMKMQNHVLNYKPGTYHIKIIQNVSGEHDSGFARLSFLT